MRYRGQGHEIAVPLPARPYRAEDAADAVPRGEYRASASRGNSIYQFHEAAKPEPKGHAHRA